VLKKWSRRRVKSALSTFWMMALVLGLVAIMAAVIDDRSITRLVTDFMVLCVLVVALQSFIGNSGILSFGHVAFFGVGAYSAALLTITPKIKAIALPALPVFIQQLQIGFVGAVLAGACLSLLVAVITGIALARMTEGAMAMATLALLVMLHSIFANWEPVTRGTIGVYGIPRNITLFNAWACTAVIGGIALLFKASPAGLCLQASRDDPLATETLGVSVTGTRLAGWILSALLMGAGGAMWSQNNLAFGPNQFYYAETFKLLSMLVIGGIGSVSGAIAGVAVVTLVGELLRGLENGLSIGAWITLPELPGVVQMTIAFLIIVILILRPQGLMGLNELSDLVLRRRTTKKNI
jgi:ABC-type branched-subunit amino acid transport system permease subunit